MGGRGKPKSGTLTQEQLQTLGCVGKELPQVQTAPPPTYAPLITKPTLLETTVSQNFQILWKEAFLTHMRNSPYYLEINDNKKVEQITCCLQDNIISNNVSIRDNLKMDFNWSIMPAELNVINKKSQTFAKRNYVSAGPIKLLKRTNIEDRLKELEEKERDENANGEEQNKTNSESEAEFDEDNVDDEMDDENDYGNSYFDNGEAYNEEDDNLDDGPIY